MSRRHIRTADRGVISYNSLRHGHVSAPRCRALARGGSALPSDGQHGSQLRPHVRTPRLAPGQAISVRGQRSPTGSSGAGRQTGLATYARGGGYQDGKGNRMPSTTGEEFDHRPVMVEEVVALFDLVPAGVFVDATIGGAGHSEAVLDAHPGLRLAGLDRDPEAVRTASERLVRFGDRASVVHARFDQLGEAAAAAGGGPITAVLFDLGVSSPQLDRPGRGFSYRLEGPLDMRMDPSGSDPTAAELVNTLSAGELTAILRTNADERFARRIAEAIVAARPITTTTQLAEIVRGAIPAPARRTGGHPATRAFQALRIAVNHELEMLEPALRSAIGLLAPGGRLVVITYHSGEDRIVKDVMRDAEHGGPPPPPGLPLPSGQVPLVRLIARGGMVPTSAEIVANPRARSARIRVAQKLGGSDG